MEQGLTVEQFQLAATSISAVTALMGLAAVYFAVASRSLRSRNRTAVTLAAAVCAIAAFHYLLAYVEWRGGFVFIAGSYVSSERPFVNSSRFADWVVTVPLLVVQVILLVDIGRRSARRLGTQLVVASLLMLALGYPAEISGDLDTKLRFLALGGVPLLYIIFLLWVTLTRSLRRLQAGVDRHVSSVRVVLVGSWLLYPIGTLLPVVFPELSVDAGWGESLRQVFYGIADLISKPLFGWFVLRAAIASDADRRGEELDRHPGIPLPQPPPLLSEPASDRPGSSA